jgi:mono/diheme cytochrome c family protein
VDSDTFKTSDEAAVRQKIVVGSSRMPGFQYALQPAQIDQIVAFLKTVTPDQKPKPAGSRP